MYDAVQRYPRMRVDLSVGVGGGGGGDSQSSTTRIRKVPGGGEWLKVGPDMEYTLTVQMRRTNPYPSRDKKEGKAFAPR